MISRTDTDEMMRDKSANVMTGQVWPLTFHVDGSIFVRYVVFSRMRLECNNSRSWLLILRLTPAISLEFVPMTIMLF